MISEVSISGVQSFVPEQALASRWGHDKHLFTQGPSIPCVLSRVTVTRVRTLCNILSLEALAHIVRWAVEAGAGGEAVEGARRRLAELGGEAEAYHYY